MESKAKCDPNPDSFQSLVDAASLEKDREDLNQMKILMLKAIK